MGCLRLRGSARAMDMAKLCHDQDRSIDPLFRFVVCFSLLCVSARKPPPLFFSARCKKPPPKDPKTFLRGPKTGCEQGLFLGRWEVPFLGHGAKAKRTRLTPSGSEGYVAWQPNREASGLTSVFCRLLVGSVVGVPVSCSFSWLTLSGWGFPFCFSGL